MGPQTGEFKSRSSEASSSSPFVFSSDLLGLGYELWGQRSARKRLETHSLDKRLHAEPPIFGQAGTKQVFGCRNLWRGVRRRDLLLPSRLFLNLPSFCCFSTFKPRSGGFEAKEKTHLNLEPNRVKCKSCVSHGCLSPS